jgi:hypothetical protein
MRIAVADDRLEDGLVVFGVVKVPISRAASFLTFSNSFVTLSSFFWIASFSCSSDMLFCRQPSVV